MTELEFWRLKISQFFHDPPGKPFHFRQRGGHQGVGTRLVEVFTGQQHPSQAPKRPDWMTAGADRPVFPLWFRHRLPTIGFRSDDDRILTHPLSPGPLLRPNLRGDETEREMTETLSQQDVEALDLEDQLESDVNTSRPANSRPANSSRDLNEESETAAQKLGISEPEWDDPNALREAYWRLWRRFRDVLGHTDGISPTERLSGDLLWERIPGETRSPDHSVWDHVRVTAALAFVDTPRKLKGRQIAVPKEKTPYLLRFSLGPVQDFILESRTSRDLWTSSMLLADLMLCAIAPLVEVYGPDCILYPDLCKNPQFDAWMKHSNGEYNSALADNADPMTFAGILPNTFVAVVPLGPDVDEPSNYLKPLANLVSQCQDAVTSRWKKLADQVHNWLRDQVPIQGTEGCSGLGSGKWEEIWARQHQNCPLHNTWMANPWLEPGRIKGQFLISGGLLCQDPKSEVRQPYSPEDQQTLAEREARFEGFIPPESWLHYEEARAVFGKTEKHLLQLERGFDYALTHHQLKLRHELRKLAGGSWSEASEDGEKCTVCKQRSALSDDAVLKRNSVNEDSSRHSSRDPIDRSRQQVRQFWKLIDRDKKGSERLCAICAFKRYLIEAGGNSGGINTTWAGETGAIEPNEKVARVPFPSTSMIACQRFLATICQDSKYRNDLADIGKLLEKSDIPETAFARSLRSLADSARRSDEARRFLRWDPQQTLFPHLIHQQKTKVATDSDVSPLILNKLEELEEAVKRLRARAKFQGVPDPETHFALIRMDGDHMSALLLGDPTQLRNPWRNVLHPRVVEAMQKEGNRQYFADVGWTRLLGSSRLMGPHLHAFINRALADFSHRIVPWVVEREFDGRLIYAGGDDVLALAPAGQAISLVARLQQLFSSPWVIDRDYQGDAWQWRRESWISGKDRLTKPCDRFATFVLDNLDRSSDGLTARVPIEFPVRIEKLEKPIIDALAYSSSEPHSDGEEVVGPVLPMLGPYQSMSAAVITAHFKTPIFPLIRRSKELLDATVKSGSGRNALGVARYSRGGLKQTMSLPWNLVGRFPPYSGDKSTIDQPFQEGDPWHIPAHELVADVQRAFRDNTLAGRLPYKLRDAIMRHHDIITLEIEKGAGWSDLDAAARRQFLRALWSSEGKNKLADFLDGMLIEVAEGSLAAPVPSPSREVLRITERHPREQLFWKVRALWLEGIVLAKHLCQNQSYWLERSVDGLLLCRAMASGLKEEDE